MGEQRRANYPEYAEFFVQMQDQSDLSNRELSEKTGISEDQISKYRNGWQQPRAVYQNKLNEAFRATPEQRERFEKLRTGQKDMPLESKEWAERAMAISQEALKHPYLSQFLKWLYPQEPFLERRGATYPVVIYPAPREQWEDYESVLAGGLERRANRLQNITDTTYRDLRERLKQNESELFNNLTFTMNTLRTHGPLEFSCGMGTYFDMLDSCDAHLWEILSNIHMLQSSSKEAFERFFNDHLPLRKRLHAEVPDFLRNGRRRSVALGGTVLLAYQEGGEYKVMIRKRSAFGVAVYGNLMLAIPSYMLQPSTEYIDKEFSVLYNTVREYGEEIFKLRDPGKNQHPDRIYNPETHKPNVYLRDLLNSGEAHLYLSGIAMDMLNLRPEICLVLVIHSSDWYRDNSPYFNLNLEWENQHTDLNRLNEVNRPFTLKPTDAEMIRDRPEIEPARMVPPGAAAFWLGIDVLRKVL